MTTKQGLTKARNYVQTHGLCKDMLQDEDGRVCVLGAINAAVFGNPCSLEASTRFTASRNALGVAIGEECVVRWNNHPNRTKRQVIAGFNKAIREQTVGMKK